MSDPFLNLDKVGRPLATIKGGSLDKRQMSIFIDGDVGHGAPWQWQLYEFTKNGKIIWEGKEQELIFTHFSQFKDSGESYTPSTMHHIYTPLSMYEDNKQLKDIYSGYHSELKKVKIKYNG